MTITIAFLPGNYVLLVSDTENGCTAAVTTAVSQDVQPPLAHAGPAQLITCSAQTRTLDGSASSTGADFAYLWQGPGINTSNFAQQSPVVADSGLYLLTVTRLSNHCTATATVAVGQNTEHPKADAGPDRTLTCAVTSVMLDGSLSASGASISYAWGGPALNPPAPTSVQASATGPGIYNLTVTDAANGCTSIDAVDVYEDVVPPTAYAGPDQSINCANAAVGVMLSSAGSSSGPDYALTWAGPGITPAMQNQPNPTVKVIGQYVLTLRNLHNGCIHTDTTNVLQDQDLPIADAGPDQTLTCVVTKVTLDASGSTDLGGGVEYTWAGPGINVNNQGQEKPAVEVSGIYTLTVANTLTGCTTTNEVSVLTDTQPPSAQLLSEVLTCAQPWGDLSAVTVPATGCTYEWAGPGINSGNINSAAFQVSQAGIYSVTVTGPNGCSTTASTTVTEDADFPNGSAEGTTLNCKNGGNSSLTGQVNTPGASAQWQGPGGLVSDSLTIEATQPGLYQFVITAANGCKRSIPVHVQPDYAAPTVQLWAGKKLTCSVTSVIIGTGGTSTGGHFSYSWSTPNGHIVSGHKGLAPVVDKAGEYTLLVTNLLNGCTSTGTIAVENDPSVPTALQVAAHDVRCFGENNGSLKVLGVTGGQPPFVYSLNGAPAVQASVPVWSGGETRTLELEFQAVEAGTVEMLTRVVMPQGGTAYRDPLPNDPGVALDQQGQAAFLNTIVVEPAVSP
ncbi:MAG TPA: hypothetical protein PKD78_09655, partial [Saprospiraceae bacterium]|nr:hypothetical protein [Saprospiraceae bacterium]